MSHSAIEAVAGQARGDLRVAGEGPSNPMAMIIRAMRGRAEPSSVSELDSGDLDAVSVWLADPRIYKWLDFGGGRQILSRSALAVAVNSGTHCIRAVRDSTGRLIGITGLQHVNSPFRTGMIWGARPTLRPPSRTNASLQIREMLRIGFTELGLRSIHAWVVERNKPSILAVLGGGMKPMGRQRLAHVIDGRSYDRLLFDIVAEEYAEQEDVLARFRSLPFRNMDISAPVMGTGA